MKQKELERIHIESFLKLMPELYSGKLIDFEVPDFILETNMGLIGIEHTQVFKKKDANGLNPIEHENESSNLLKLAEDEFNRLSNSGVHVDVFFRFDYGFGNISNPVQLTAKERKKLIMPLVEFVRENIPPEGEFLGFENPDPHKGNAYLPIEIRDIVISNRRNSDKSLWTCMNAGMVPEFFSGSTFHNALSNKNQIHGKYSREYDSTWLVMVVDINLFASYFNFQEIKFPQIDTQYDKVFIYRHGEHKCHELPKKAG